MGRAAWLLLVGALGCASMGPNGAHSALTPESAARAASKIPAEDVAHAGELLQAGQRAYRHGDYAAAEGLLKEALALYPFSAPANMLLGKIFLMQGSAADDLSRLQDARRMFEMAHAIDPTLEENSMLLDLIQRRSER